MKKTIVKICGLKDQESLQAAVAAGADLVGFVHYAPSPRHVSPESAVKLRHELPAHVKSVALLVNPDDQTIREVQQILNPDYIQLHGKETPERVNDIKAMFPELKIIKAIGISEAGDLDAVTGYAPLVDIMMFDAKPPKTPDALPGGNGVAFDWTLLKGLQLSTPWMLSGGLTPRNVRDAMTQSGAKMIDVSSGVEQAPGVKDPQRIEAFIQAAKHQ
jgi:phosphoribosylanthranilate isomerase